MCFCSIMVRKRVIKMMFRCEWKKILSKKINRIMICAAAVLAVVFSCFAIGSVRYVDKNGALHTGIAAARKLSADRNRWEGDLTAEKFAEIVKSKQKLAKKYPQGIPDDEYGKIIQSYGDIESFVINVVLNDAEYNENVLYQMTEKQSKELYAAYEENMQKMAGEYGGTPEQVEFLKKQYRKIKMPLSYQAKDSWDTMETYVETYGIVLAVIIGFLASGIFAEEFRTKADSVFFAAKYGRSKAVKNKAAAGMLMTTVVYWGGMAILTLVSLGVMGISGFQTLYQIDQPYSMYVMTYGQYYLMMLVCGYIASLFAASLSMLVSAKMHSRNIAAGIPFFLYCLMPFIGRMFSSVTVVFRLVPDVLFNIMANAKNLTVFQIGNTVFRQIPAVMLLYAVLSVLLLPLVYRSYCRYGLRPH